MTRPIDAESLKLHFVTDTPLFAYDIVRGVNIMIDNEPTLDVAPVRHGHWKHDAEGFSFCSECGHRHVWDYNFCPDCGARMDAERKDNG